MTETNGEHRENRIVFMQKPNSSMHHCIIDLLWKKKSTFFFKLNAILIEEREKYISGWKEY